MVSLSDTFTRLAVITGSGRAQREVFVMAQVSLLVSELKRYLKAHGLTYAEVGKQLELSESSVKRLFARETFSLQRFEQV